MTIVTKVCDICQNIVSYSFLQRLVYILTSTCLYADIDMSFAFPITTFRNSNICTDLLLIINAFVIKKH